MAARRYSVGLTGGIGSGKSTVADLLAARGVAVVDTDRIAHELTAPGGAAIPAIRDAFGDSVILPDGSLDRRAMRDAVFSDPQAKATLERILHPMIGVETARQGAAASSPYIVYVVPLLVESRNWRDRVDRVLVVDCDEEEQVRRVMARSAMSAQQVRPIMAAQATRAQRLAAADDVIVNDSTVEKLETAVAALHAAYLKRAAAPTG